MRWRRRICQSPGYARNLGLIVHSDQGGRPDGMQLMAHDGHAHPRDIFSKGFSIVDMHDPRKLRAP